MTTFIDMPGKYTFEELKILIPQAGLEEVNDISHHIRAMEEAANLSFQEYNELLRMVSRRVVEISAQNRKRVV